MIEMPRRSVTRFFIPLIDVLTLLFCIYLLMPIVNKRGLTGEASARALEQQVRHLRGELARRERENPGLTDQLRKEIDLLRKEKGKVLQERLTVRVLEIDGDTGKLSYRDPDRIDIASEAAARELIDRDRRERGVGSRELYYLILYPRDRSSAYPTQEQRRRYDRWFEGVALGYDVPGGEVKP